MAELHKFYVPKQMAIYKTIVDDYEEFNINLKDAILKHRELNPESNKSNVKAWHSSYHTHKINPHFQPLIDLTLGACNFISVGDFVGHAYDIKYEVINLWTMMYEDSEWTTRHSHFPSTFSACYYVDVEPDCAPIIFESIQNDGVNDYNQPLEIQPENGMLLIWPSMLEHEVPPTKGKRMAISMNINIQPPSSDETTRSTNDKKT